MGTIRIELVEDGLWGLFTEEEKPRIISSTLLVREGQVTQIDEDDLTPNQLYALEASYKLGAVKVLGASFLSVDPVEAKCEVFNDEEEDKEESDTDFQKMMKEKIKRVKESREERKPKVDQEEIAAFLKKRQDKIIVETKKQTKSLAFYKACLAKEQLRKKPRKKVVEALKEGIEYKIASIKDDYGGIDVTKMSDMKNLARGSSYLESQYSEMIEEEELEEPEEEPEINKEELLDILKKLEED